MEIKKWSILSLSVENQIKPNKIKQKSTSFDSWMSLSSLEPGQRILIPFEKNGYFQGKEGIIKNSVQIDLSKNKEMKFYFQKDLKGEKQRLKKNNIKISLDLGLSILFVSNSGDYYGKGFINTLSKFDNQLMKLQKALIDKEKNTGIKVKFNDNQKCKKLVEKTNEYIKNTINYNMNLIIKNEKPSEIVIESLNFQSPYLSKKLNRIIGHFGKGLTTKKFEEFKEIGERYYGKRTEIRQFLVDIHLETPTVKDFILNPKKYHIANSLALALGLS